MNNNFLNPSQEEEKVVSSREKVERLTEIIEALQNIANSNYWKVLQNNVFDVELAKSKRRLEGANDPTEIFRLQGEIKLGRRYQLEKLLTKYRDELTSISKNI